MHGSEASLLPCTVPRHGWDPVRIASSRAPSLPPTDVSPDFSVLVVVGPIVGGWVSESRLGWRFSFWIMFIVSALNALACIFITPETVSRQMHRLRRLLTTSALDCGQFAPVLLRRRARQLTKASGGHAVYISRLDATRDVSLSEILKRDMGRPFCACDILPSACPPIHTQPQIF